MSTTTKETLADLERQANELAAAEVLTATNEGTFSTVECHAAIGTGNSAAGTWKVYTRVGDGRTSYTGCKYDRAPGVPRHFSRELSAKQAELRQMRKRIEALKS